MSLTVGFVLSDESSALRVRRLLIWMICLLMFSPIYLFLTFSLTNANLLAALLAGFAFSLGMTISKLHNRALKTETGNSEAPI